MSNTQNINEVRQELESKIGSKASDSTFKWAVGWIVTLFLGSAGFLWDAYSKLDKKTDEIKDKILGLETRVVALENKAPNGADREEVA
jgi:hypothetical protein